MVLHLVTPLGVHKFARGMKLKMISKSVTACWEKVLHLIILVAHEMMKI
jgi:hypothetical protein